MSIEGADWSMKDPIQRILNWTAVKLKSISWVIAGVGDYVNRLGHKVGDLYMERYRKHEEREGNE